MQIKVIYPEIGWRPHQILFVYIHYDNVWLIKIYFKLRCKCHFDKTEVVSEFFYLYFSCYLHFTMFWCISCFGERFQSSIRANMYKTKTVGAFIVLPLVSTFNTPFVQLDDNGTNCTCSNKPWTFFAYKCYWFYQCYQWESNGNVGNIDYGFVNMSHNKHLFTALIKQQHVYHKLHPDHHS